MRKALGAFLLSALCLGAAPANAAECSQGPLRRTFGGQPWLVYACTGDAFLVVVSDAGNPATPYVFTIVQSQDGFRILGQGAGSTAVTNAAMADLRKLGVAELNEMAKAARQAGSNSK